MNKPVLLVVDAEQDVDQVDIHFDRRLRFLRRRFLRQSRYRGEHTQKAG